MNNVFLLWQKGISILSPSTRPISLSINAASLLSIFHIHSSIFVFVHLLIAPFSFSLFANAVRHLHRLDDALPIYCTSIASGALILVIESSNSRGGRGGRECSRAEIKIVPTGTGNPWRWRGDRCPYEGNFFDEERQEIQQRIQRHHNAVNIAAKALCFMCSILMLVILLLLPYW